MLDFTVAIPTYNGAERLPQVLEKVRSQIQTESLKWEVIVIDNNSSDNTEEVVKNYQETWPRSIPLKYILESEQGAAFARLRAVKEAKGEYIAFLDDDNWPEPNWLISAYSFCKEHPQAGAIGGQIHANYEIPPPENFKPIEPFLAIREHGSQPFRFDAANLRLPPAASLIVRKQAWQESVPPRPSLTGKLPGLLIQGDDYEPLLYLHKHGWEIWYNPEMHTYHQIPKWRLEKDYLLKLAQGCGLATCKLLMINAKPWQKPWIILRTIVGNGKRLVLHFLKYKGKLKNNLTATFQINFYLQCSLSPIELLRKR